MGCGKTHIGRMLAKALDLPFIDCDKEIEIEQGATISDIFATSGEDAFRRMEYEMIEKTLAKGAPVISTGGGAFVYEDTRQAILDKGLSIWLDADIEILYERVSRNNKRPLLQTDNPKQTLIDLLEKRKPYYAQAQIHIRSDQVDSKVLEDINKALYGALNLD